MMHINEDNDADICRFAAMLAAAEMRGHTRGYEQGLKDTPTQLDDAKRAAEKAGYDKGYEAARAHALNFIHDGTGPRGTIDLAYHLKNRDERMRESWRTNELPKAVEGVRKLGFDKGYAKATADAMKGFPEHLPAIDPESRKKLNATINEAAEFIRKEAYDKGYAEATADAMKVARREDPIAVAMVPLSDALRGRENLHHRLGRAEGHEEGFQKGLREARESAIREVEEAWSWWIGATVEGRTRPNDTSGNTARDRAAYYLAQAAQWVWNHNNVEVSGPLTRAMVLQEGRKEGHAAAVDFAKQVIAGMRDPSYGIQDAVDARVRSAETKAGDEGYVRGRDEAFHSAGLMVQAALKSGGFVKLDNEAKELAEALDGFLERERSPGDISRRIWNSATALTKAYTAGDTVGIGSGGQAQLFTLLRKLRQDSYIDGFEKARLRASNAAGGIQVPERNEIPDPVSDVPF